MAEFPSSDWVVQVSLGNVPGVRPIIFLGKTPGVLSTDTYETIWDQAGVYTYLTTDTQLCASSTNASDTQLVQVTGLDANYNEITVFATLNGQTQVALSGLMFRVFTAINATATDFVGEIYIAESDTLTAGVPDTVSKIKAKIPFAEDTTVSNNTTGMETVWTIPAGKQFLLVGERFFPGKNSDCSITARLRPPGGVWYSVPAVDVYQVPMIIDNVRPHLLVEEKWDAEFVVRSDNITTAVAVTYSGFLIDK